MEFFYWAPGEPSDNTGFNENCVEMLQDTGMWNDVTCDADNKWICKTDKGGIIIITIIKMIIIIIITICIYLKMRQYPALGAAQRRHYNKGLLT